jgi:hypothetical protein
MGSNVYNNYIMEFFEKMSEDEKDYDEETNAESNTEFKLILINLSPDTHECTKLPILFVFNVC